MGAEITYTRSGGRGTPPERESITVHADGTFVAWRSVGAAAAGRFEGTLPSSLASSLSAAHASASAAGAPDVPTLLPGAPRETITVDGDAGVDVAKSTVGAWADLRGALRSSLDAAVDFPAAAIRLSVDTSGPSATLSRVGSSPIDVDLTDATALAVLWSPNWEEKGRAPLEVTSPDAKLAIDPALHPAGGDRLQVTVTLKLADNGRPVPVQLVAEAVG